MTHSPTLEQLSDEVRAFGEAREWGQYHSPRNLAMALSVEAAELLELYLWCEDAGPQPLRESRKERVADEAADILICLLNFCDKANVDLASAMRSKLKRAAVKYPAERVRGKALKYDEYDDYDPEAP